MKRSKKPVRYQGFNLEIPLINEIKEHIKDNDRYRSVTDYVRQTLRNQLDLEKHLNFKKRYISNKLGNMDNIEKICLSHGFSKEVAVAVAIALDGVQEQLNLLIRVFDNHDWFCNCDEFPECEDFKMFEKMKQRINTLFDRHYDANFMDW